MHWQKKIVPFAVFFLVANPETFKIVRGILGDWVASPAGLPTQQGVLLHALVYVIVAHIAWKLFYGKKSGFGGQGANGQACTQDSDCMYGCTNKMCT